MKKVKVFLRFGNLVYMYIHYNRILRGDAMSLNASKLQSETIVGSGQFSFFKNFKTTVTV